MAMWMPGRTDRRSALGAALFAGLITLAVDPGQTAPAAPPPTEVAILRGRVTDEAGKPLADVRVHAAIPAIDMRFVDEIRPGRLVEARTDADGNYRVEIAGLSGRTTASLDAMKP